MFNVLFSRVKIFVDLFPASILINIFLHSTIYSNQSIFAFIYFISFTFSMKTIILNSLYYRKENSYEIKKILYNNIKFTLNCWYN
jgi:hypothetical protein